MRLFPGGILELRWAHSGQAPRVTAVLTPGCEGKVGMAAVKLAAGRTLDGPALYRHVRASLPSYAVPRFIRIQVSSGGRARAGPGS